MANTGLPSNLYSGGAVVFNSQPSVNFYAQLMQRQQAKRDALDQYYQKALMDVTPAGMRNVDITGGFTKKLNDWQEFAMNPQNRKYLLNPRLDQYKTATQFNQMHADLLSDIQKSKEAAADEKTLNTYRLNGRWNPTDDDLNIAHNMGLSIYDPIRKDVGLNDLSVNMPQYTPLQEKQAYQAATQGLKPSNTNHPYYHREINKAQVATENQQKADLLKQKEIERQAAIDKKNAEDSANIYNNEDLQAYFGARNGHLAIVPRNGSIVDPMFMCMVMSMQAH